MENIKAFEVRLSRWIILFFLIAGVLFLLGGLDLVLFKKVIGPQLSADNPIITWIIAILAMLAGGLIFTVQAYYLIIPPLLFSITDQKITFGTGLRYKPDSIATRYLKGVEFRKGSSIQKISGQQQVVEGGLILYFQKSKGLPKMLPAAPGVIYADYCLRLSRLYMNRTINDVIAAIKERTHLTSRQSDAESE